MEGTNKTKVSVMLTLKQLEALDGMLQGVDPKNLTRFYREPGRRAKEAVHQALMEHGFGKPSIEDQSRNGVRVVVHRSKDGSGVDASCQCFGAPFRAHSNPQCPNIPKGRQVILPPPKTARSNEPAYRLDDPAIPTDLRGETPKRLWTLLQHYTKLPVEPRHRVNAFLIAGAVVFC